jgi:hypothetical protein
MLTLSTQTYTTADETFIQTKYNDVSIMVRTKDKYINASHLCTAAHKDFRTFCKTKRWSQIIQFWGISRKNETAQKPAVYEIKKGFNDAVFGKYIHPELIHFVAEYVSIEYSFKVKHIMDTINEFSEVTGQSFDETKDQLINQMQATIDSQRLIIEAKDSKIVETSTRTPDNSSKILTIFAYGEGFKLSADSTNPRKHFLLRFVFPATMNVKQDIKKAVHSYSFENFDTCDTILSTIRSFEPKSEIIGDEEVPK